MKDAHPTPPPPSPRDRVLGVFTWFVAAGILCTVVGAALVLGLGGAILAFGVCLLYVARLYMLAARF